MFISSVVMGVMAEVFISTWRTQLNQEARTQLQQSSRASIDVLSTTTRQSSGVIDTINVNATTYTSTATSVVLKLASLDVNGSPTDLTDYIIFQVDPNNAAHLQRVLYADPSSSRASQTALIDLTTELNALTIQYYDSSGLEMVPGNGSLRTAASLRFTVATSRNVNQQTVVSSLNDMANLRNR